MHIAEYTMSLTQSSSEMWTETEKNPHECWDKCVLLPSANDYQYICVSISQRANVPVSGLRQPTPYFQQGKTFGLDAHTHLWLQPSTMKSAREFEWGVCVCSFQRALYPCPCQLVVLSDLCTTKMIHTHSRRKAALAALLPATAPQE